MKTRPYATRVCQLTFVLLGSVSLLFARSQNPNDRPIQPIIDELKTFVTNGMQKTGVPGVAVAVVYRDHVVYLDGFGFRKVGSTARVNTNTVFQLASVSKPIASTIVAELVGNHEVTESSILIRVLRYPARM